MKMVRMLSRLFNVYANEFKLLLWVIAIHFLMKISSILLTNYSEAAFLKRYGVENLPMVLLINALVVFFLMNVLGVIMDRFRTTRVFTGALLFFALGVGLIRVLLSYHFVVLYPILYMLKATAISILPIMFIDILNDLYTTRQAKRLFTLVSAGGILGTVLGSYLTGGAADWLGADNLLLVFVGGMVATALLNEHTEWLVGAPIQPRTTRRRHKKRGDLAETFRTVRDLAQRSPFLKYMVIIVAIPNMVLPILTFQFNVVVDRTYASEEGILQFFGLFRSFYNTWIFIALLFSGRLLNRWGVANSLLFHPLNYLVAFGALFFRFDLLSGMYARLSTETLKTTLNNPARAVLYNFFPPSVRGKVRVFLRGTVVRAAKLSGSGLLMLVKGVVDAPMLSLMAAPMVIIWAFANFRIKKNYSSMLVQTLMEQQIDWRRLEDVNLQELAKDKGTIAALRGGLHDQSSDVAVLCGELLAQIRPPGWTAWIVEVLPEKPPAVQTSLLRLIPSSAAPDVMPALSRYARQTSSEELATLLPTLSRLDPVVSLSIAGDFVDHPDAAVRTQALAALYRSGVPDAQQRCRRRLEALLEDHSPETVGVALHVLEEIGDPYFISTLREWAKSENADFRSSALYGLIKAGAEGTVDLAAEAVDDPSPQVRRAALQVMVESDAAPLDLLLARLADDDAHVRELAGHALRRRGPEVAQSLIPALASPSRTLRNEIIAILRDFESRPVELSQFINRELQKAYQNLAIMQTLEKEDSSAAIALLCKHLHETNQEILETLLRVLAVQEFGDQMDVIRRAIQTGDKRDIDNAIEALESSLHAGIRRQLIPLFEEIPLEEKLARGRKRLSASIEMPESDFAGLQRLVSEADPVTRALAVYALGELHWVARAREELETARRDDDHPIVRDAALWGLAQPEESGATDGGPSTGCPFLEKLNHVRKVPMFADLRIRELTAITEITMEKPCDRGEMIVREGDPGDVLYLVLWGELQVVKGMGTRQEIMLARIQSEDFFGEMALFDRRPRSASVVAGRRSMLLAIRGRTFEDLMEHYPAIPMNICRVLSQRIRDMHEKLEEKLAAPDTGKNRPLRHRA
jgi:HEAT repeat protein/MFS family permease